MQAIRTGRRDSPLGLALQFGAVSRYVAEATEDVLAGNAKDDAADGKAHDALATLEKFSKERGRSCEDIASALRLIGSALNFWSRGRREENSGQVVAIFSKIVEIQTVWSAA